MTAVKKARSDEAALRKARMLIGGKWVESASGEVLEVEDPAHRRPVAEIPRGGVEDVARAVNAAAEAFPAWSRMIPRERGQLLARADALEPRIEELARTIALDTGNALRTQARPEAKTTVDIIRHFGGLGGELKGETIALGEQLGQKVRALKLGDPLDEASDIGTVINEKQFRKVCGYVEEGLNRREARVVIGGLSPKEGPLSGASSAAFKTSVLPAQSAGPILRAARSTGAFHGMMAPTTPSGSRRV